MNTRSDGPGCRRVCWLLQDFVDGELPVAEARIVRRHLRTCGPCGARHAFASALIRELRIRAGQIRVPPEALERINAALAELAPGGSVVLEESLDAVAPP